MQAFLILLAIGVLFGPWILLIVSAVRRRSEKLRQEARWVEQSTRLRLLEDTVQRLQRSVSPAPPPARTPEPPPRPVIEPIIVEPIAVERNEVPAIPLSPPPQPSPLPDRPSAEPPPLPFTPEPAIFAPQPTLIDRLLGGVHFEEALGANWLNKIGVVVLVFGIAFFLAYQLRQVGPMGKVITGFAVSGALLGGGVFLETRSRYRIFAYGGIGGGWALAFFTTYAMYHVAAARVLASQTPDLFLMLVVAAAMVAHTLRYRSQTVTGLAFLLAFSTLTISQVTVYSLGAGVILTLGLVIITGRMQWFELELAGIAAAYLNHWLWLRRIVEPMGDHKQDFSEFFLSAAILVLYWAIFRASYIARRCTAYQEKVSAAGALLNSFALLAILKYQSVHPEWTFRALLALGIAELALSQIQRMRRRPAFLLLATIGTSLLLAAIPFRFGGGALDALWSAEAGALLVAGIAVREILYRRMAMVAIVLVFIDVVSGVAAPLAALRWEHFVWLADWRAASLLFMPSLLMLGGSPWVVSRWPELFENTFDRTVMHRLPLGGALLFYLAVWAAFPGINTAPAWALAGCLLLAAGVRFRLEQHAWSAHFFQAGALFAAIFFSLPATDVDANGVLPAFETAVVAVVGYTASRWSRAGLERWMPHTRWLPVLWRCTASLLLVLLAWFSSNSLSVAPEWVILAVFLIEAGLLLELPDVRLQGYAIAIFAFGAIFFVNLNAEPAGTGLSPRIATVAPVIAALYYLYFRLEHWDQACDQAIEEPFRAASASAWLAAIAAAALLRFELSPDWVASAWAVGSLALMLAAWLWNRPIFLHQGVFFCFASSARAGFHNLYERSWLPAPFWSSRAVSTSAVIAILLCGLVLAFRLRTPGPVPEGSPVKRLLDACIRRPEQVFFFLPLILLVSLLAVEMPGGLVTLSWSVLGVAVFVFALFVGERSFRLSGLVLLLLGVAKVALVDAWRLTPRDRYLTLIVMGSALLLVSFLYTRYREVIRKYL